MPVPAEGLALEAIWQSCSSWEGKAGASPEPSACSLKDFAPSPWLQRKLGRLVPQAWSALSNPKPAAVSECLTFPSRAAGRYPRHAKKVTELEAVTVHRFVLGLGTPPVSVWKQKAFCLLTSLCCGRAPAPT